MVTGHLEVCEILSWACFYEESIGQRVMYSREAVESDLATYCPLYIQRCFLFIKKRGMCTHTHTKLPSLLYYSTRDDLFLPVVQRSCDSQGYGLDETHWMSFALPKVSLKVNVDSLDEFCFAESLTQS